MSLAYDYQTFLSLFYVLGPAWVFFLYPVFSKWGRLASPWLVLPGFVAGSLVLFWLTGYSHYAVLPVLFSGLYLYLLKGLGLKAPDSLAVALMAILASDQLWQIPTYYETWSQGAYAAEIGLATACFSMMSVPFVFFLLWRATGALKLDSGARLFAVCLPLDWLVEAANYRLSFGSLYWEMPAWVVFFALVARSSTLSSAKAQRALVAGSSMSRQLPLRLVHAVKLHLSPR